MADLYALLDRATWLLLMGPPAALLASSLTSSVKALLVGVSSRSLGLGTAITLFWKEVSAMNPTLRAEHTRLNRERNLTLAFLEHLTEAAALTLPVDPALDTLPQRALRQQLQASTSWCDTLRERDLFRSEREAA